MLTPAQNADILRNNMNNLPESQRGFAYDLIAKLNERGSLSDKQVWWLNKLATAAADGPVPERQTITVENPTALFALFTIPAGKKRAPTVRRETADGRPVVISMAGNRSRHTGSLNVTDGGPYGANIWYGRISPDGRWTLADNTDAAVIAAVNADAAPKKPAKRTRGVKADIPETDAKPRRRK